MYLFKTSGDTFKSVISNEKHAFVNMPRDWSQGELVLVSKNKADCNHNEKQIQYVMRIVDIRPLRSGEIQLYWPGNEGRWQYLVICKDTKIINQPFDLEEILGLAYKPYKTIMTFRKIPANHTMLIESYLQNVGVL